MKHSLLFICIMILFLYGCTGKHYNDSSVSSDAGTARQQTEAEALPEGLFLPVEGLPGIGECSASGYESREDQFPNIASVTYLAGETAITLQTGDERVFRLLNFIGRSLDEGSFGMQFGYEEPDDITQWYEDPEPMLEITFIRADAPAAKGLGLCSKLLIRGGTVLKILDERLFEDQTERGVLLWPYNLLLNKNAEKYLRYPETERWIDLLVYAGFSE